MKTIFKLVLALLVSFSLMSTSCSSSDDDDGSNNNANPQEVINIAQSGNWVITYFFDTDSDETSDFNGYTFTFADAGVLTATNGSSTITGMWSVTNSSSSSSSSDDLDFNISFVSPPDFEELSDDWDIITYTSTKIELIDVSGGNGGTDYLTFEKQ